MDEDNKTPQPVAPESKEDVKIEQPVENSPAPIPYDRFKEVNSKYQETKQQLEEYEKQKAIEQGKYKELAEKYENELKSYREQVNTERVNSAITAELAKHSPSNLDVVKRLVDMGSVTVGEDGTIEGLSQAIEKVKSEVPQLFTTQPPANAGVKVGTEPVGLPYFKESQLTDSSFVAANLKEIEKAQAEGRIKLGE